MMQGDLAGAVAQFGEVVAEAERGSRRLGTASGRMVQC